MVCKLLSLAGAAPPNLARMLSRPRVPFLVQAVVALVICGVAAPTASAIVPIPPTPWLTPVPPPTRAPDHEQAAICEEEGVLCPDIAMRAPYQFTPDTIGGKRVLRAANAVLSIGPGPIEVRGTRTGPRTMRAVQYVHREKNRVSKRVPGNAGHIIFKAIPGQGRYWKFQNAARFELWTTGSSPRRIRVGPKLTYCLRDLRRLWDWRRSPKAEVYPACSRNANIQRVTLGTSPGWADIYPAPYYEQWIQVGDLPAGCYTLYHVADPLNELIETNEDNNAAATRVRLPLGESAAQRC